MKRLFIYIFVLLFFSNSYAKDVSEFFNNLIPGEGLTEASIQIYLLSLVYILKKQMDIID